MESPYDKKRQFIINAVYILLVVAIVYLIFKYAISLLSPFILAFLIAYVLKGPAKAISRWTKLPNKLVSFILVLVFYGGAGILIALVGVKLISILSNTFTALPEIYEYQLRPFLLTTFDGIEQTVFLIDPALVDVLNTASEQLVNYLGDNVTSISLTFVSFLSDFATSLPGFLIKVLLMVIATFFMAVDYEVLSSFVLRQFSEKTNEIIQTIKNYIVNTLFVVIRSYALIMSITFVELSVGLSIVGIDNPILIAFFIAIFDILPVLGTGGVMIPWTIMTLIQGDYQTALGLLMVYVFVTIIRNIIEPKIVGGQLGLHPVVTLISMFLGANLLGVLGLFGFPIALSLLKHLNDVGTVKVFK
ncbi:MAG: sporulation integral membrane protein YtvI [Acetobacterium woodii]|nr:sporulation integral membrane protein YtvI [Acetobacterium woodii]